MMEHFAIQEILNVSGLKTCFFVLEVSSLEKIFDSLLNKKISIKLIMKLEKSLDYK